MIIDEKLKQWATPAQAGYIDAVNQTGSKTGAAKQLNIHRKMIQKGIKAVELKASKAGYAPDHGMNHPAPPGRFVPKSTVHFGPNGEVKNEWVRFSVDNEIFIGQVRDAISAFCEQDVAPITPMGPSPLQCSEDIIPWINIGDAHFGMLAHASETGYDFNLEIAEREMLGAFGILIDECLPVDRLVIQDMGDFTHYDNTSQVTERSRNPLDCSLTYPDMIRVYSRTMRWMVEKALTKAKHVDVIINQANHSRSNDWWMAELLKVAFGHTGRVTVLNNDTPFIGYRMGKTFVLCHHSDLVKSKGLVDVMTTDFREDYGQCEFHYVDIGHIHHEMVVKQHPSVRIESFNQLARPDKHAFWNGYRNRNSITMVLRSKKYGEVGRRVLSINELQDRIYGKVTPSQRPVHRVA